MPFIEAPSNFYLGRYYDPESQRISDEVVYYESRDLTTHAVVVGMTGSGKTGLCITLLEEAALDSIPAIIIDPKGDITNLLLTFPDLQAQSFLPWVNSGDAARAGLRPEEYAQDIAQRWREGLESWGIGPQRLTTLKNSAQFNIYTPGSDAGLPISILATMRAPREGWAGHEEYHREHIRALTTALLALIGIKANPVKDREHILISNIFEHAWRHGVDLSLQDIIMQVQRPPFPTLGAFDIETLFPEKDRFKLAIELNNIIAAPSFQSWLQGEPLDFNNLLYVQTPQGPKPRINVFYIAHLSESQRSFMITLILESVLAGMRRMRGTSSLRALIYFDEVFGHFPPYPKNPPTKEPLMRLLKQGRAFGIGTVLATQNPGDLDYKGLSNAGTWFIGRLQTENDKKRVLDGLATASTANNPLDTGDLDRLISSVDPRVFVMNNVHDPRGPSLIHSRWAMSFLSGPLTREQIYRLTRMQKQQMPQSYAAPPQPGYGPPAYTPPAAPTGHQQQQMSHTPPPAYEAAAPPPPPGATPPPPSLPEAPSGGFAAPPPPPTLPESTSGLGQAPPPPYQQEASAYQAPAAPYGQNDPYGSTSYQPPAAPYSQTPEPYQAPQQQAYQPPPPPYQGQADAYSQYQPPRSVPQREDLYASSGQYQPPAPPYQGQTDSYSPSQYQPPTPPHQGQADTYSPAQYNPPTAPYGSGGSDAYNPYQSASVDTGPYSPDRGVQVSHQPDSRLPKGYVSNQPVLASTIDQYFLPTVITLQQAIARWEQQNRQRATKFGGDPIIVYTPFLLAQLQARYLDRKTGINTIEIYAYHVFNLERTGLVHWDQHVAPRVITTAISSSPLEEAAFGEPSPGLKDKSRLSALKKEVVDYIYKTAGITVPHNPTLKIYGTPGMSYRDYQSQVVAAAREGRDKEIDSVTAKFEREFDRLEDRYRREARELRADEQELRDLGREELFTAGEAVLSLLKGRTAYTLSRVSRTRRYKGQAREDVSESNEVLAELDREMDELQRKFEYELHKISQKWNNIANEVQEKRITPYKKDIHSELFGVGWMPEYLMVIQGQMERMPAWEGQRQRESYQDQPRSVSRGGQRQAALPPQSGYDDRQESDPYYDTGYRDRDERSHDPRYDDGHYYPH